MSQNYHLKKTHFEFGNPVESVENLSAREKNVRKRQKRKLAKEMDETSKKQKIAALAYSINDSQKESLSTVSWPLEIFCQYLRNDLKR